MDNKSDNLTTISEENKDNIITENKTDFNTNSKKILNFIKSKMFKQVAILIIVFLLGVFVGNLGDSSPNATKNTEEIVSTTNITDEDKAIEMFLNQRMYNGYTVTYGEVFEAVCQKTEYRIICEPSESGEEGTYKITVSGEFQVQPNNSLTDRFILDYDVNTLTKKITLERDVYESDLMIWGYWVNTGAVTRYHQHNLIY